MKNNDPYLNAGIEQTWEFAHPSNRAYTGPLQKIYKDDVCTILCCYVGSFKT